MRLVFHVAFAFVTVVVLGAAWVAAIGTTRIAPVPIAIVALYLGLTSRGHLASAVAASIVAGYLADVTTGAPVGLFALTAAVTTIIAHVAQGRFVVRGHVVGAMVSALAAVFFLVLTALLGRAVGLQRGGEISITMLASCGGLSAFVGAAQLVAHRRIDARLARTQRERDATLEGVASA